METKATEDRTCIIQRSWTQSYHLYIRVSFPHLGKQGFTCYAIIWSHRDPMVSKFGVTSIILGSPTQNVGFTLWHSKKYASYTHLCNKKLYVTGFDYYSTINGYTVKTCDTQTFISAKLNCAWKCLILGFLHVCKKGSQPSQSQIFIILVHLTWWISIY